MRSQVEQRFAGKPRRELALLLDFRMGEVGKATTRIALGHTVCSSSELRGCRHEGLFQRTNALYSSTPQNVVHYLRRRFRRRRRHKSKNGSNRKTFPFIQLYHVHTPLLLKKLRAT